MKQFRDSVADAFVSGLLVVVPLRFPFVQRPLRAVS